MQYVLILKMVFLVKKKGHYVTEHLKKKDYNEPFVTENIKYN